MSGLNFSTIFSGFITDYLLYISAEAKHTLLIYCIKLFMFQFCFNLVHMFCSFSYVLFMLPM